MKTLFMRFATVFMTVCIAYAVSGCNTMRGMGKDIERTGEVIQDSTRKR